MHRILVLANSRKMQGRCVAGYALNADRWVRPVGTSTTGELTDTEASVLLPSGDSRMVQVGDIIDVPLGAPRPTIWHPEDVELIGPMRLVQTVPIASIASIASEALTPDIPLLGNGGDRVNVTEIKSRAAHTSLQLTHAATLTCYWRSRAGREAQLRGRFLVRNELLDLSITDIAFLERHRPAEETLEISNATLTVSLANPFRPHGSLNSYCYKIIAAVMEP